jgi:osmotically-inducible protein OsmY
MTLRRVAKSYDEIARNTVRNPDTSFRPSQEEEQLARHRFGQPTEHRLHALSARESELLERVERALVADVNLDLEGVSVDIDDEEVVLTGRVPGPATAIRVQEIAGAVLGVRSVDNQLVVRGHR